ncbi:phosphoribosylanthranilate isomerase [Niabella insulamsoli]|uniref:phosphoribosylanthranilate isomerase n=1 Tax=Niabella insulamsoli TaxID=3144874 RepID=UPI0031FD743F
MKEIKIKVCGMTSLEQVRQLAAMHIDYAGFIFYEKSPRFLSDKIAPADLRSVAGIKKVGVFVNEATDKIRTAVKDYGLDAVQLHGDETPEFCRTLRSETAVIKAFRVSGDEDLSAMIKPYEANVDYFLFDTKAKEYGGTGRKFDWSVLEKSAIVKPYFLSGGIGLNDGEQLRAFTSANEVFSLDVNSKFETEPGVKDLELVKSFLSKIK